jgi:hypothetical protein
MNNGNNKESNTFVEKLRSSSQPINGKKGYFSGFINALDEVLKDTNTSEPKLVGFASFATIEKNRNDGRKPGEIRI